MTCPKCQGLVIDDAGDVRCVNCGCRPVIGVVNETRKEESGMPRFTSEEGRQRWMTAMAKRREEKRGSKELLGGGQVRACSR